MNSSDETERECRSCKKPIGYGLGIFKNKWYHVHDGDSKSCSGPIYPLPVKEKKSVTSSPEQEAEIESSEGRL